MICLNRKAMISFMALRFYGATGVFFLNCTLPKRNAFKRREVAAFLRTAEFFFVTCRGYQDVNILDASHIALMTYVGPHVKDGNPLDPMGLPVG